MWVQRGQIAGLTAAHTICRPPPKGTNRREESLNTTFLETLAYRLFLTEPPAKALTSVPDTPQTLSVRNSILRTAPRPKHRRPSEDRIGPHEAREERSSEWEPLERESHPRQHRRTTRGKRGEELQMGAPREREPPKTASMNNNELTDLRSHTPPGDARTLREYLATPHTEKTASVLYFFVLK